MLSEILVTEFIWKFIPQKNHLGGLAAPQNREPSKNVANVFLYKMGVPNPSIPGAHLGF